MAVQSISDVNANDARSNEASPNPIANATTERVLMFIRVIYVEAYKEEGIGEL